MAQPVAPEELSGGEFLSARLAVAEEEAAGGVCSRLVLYLMHDIDATLKDPETPVLGRSCELFGVYGENIRLKTLGVSRIRGRLALAAEEGVMHDDGVKTQTVFVVDARTSAALPLWRLIEEPMNSGRCSRTLFLPALEEDDLDWSQVVTSTDERAAMSLDESLKSEPVTNADVLELLTKALHDDEKSAKLAKLFNLVQLEAVWQKYIEEVDPFTDGDYANARQLPDLMHRTLANSQEWLALGGGVISRRRKVEGGNILFTVDPGAAPDRIQVTAEFPKLGSNGPRQQPLGSLVLHDQMSQEPVFLTVAEEEAPSIEAEVVSRHAQEAFSVPEFVQDTELITEINDWLRKVATSTVTPAIADKKICEAISECRKKLEIQDECLDLGEIDIRGLGQMDILSDLYRGLYRVTVYADKNQRVAFNPSRRLVNVTFHDSYVNGAQAAFCSGPTTIRCATVNCSNAFNIGETALDCVAVGAKQAFSGPGLYEGNLIADTIEGYLSYGLGSKGRFIGNIALGGERVFKGGSVAKDNVAVGRYGRKEVFRREVVKVKKERMLRKKAKPVFKRGSRKDEDGNILIRTPKSKS